jgi:[ribosomal protein S5]-alanine N-acetyltransferase
MTPDDAASAFELNSDPLVIRYTGDPPFDSIEHARKFLSAYDHYRKYGFGRWAVIRKTDETFLGWCGLKYTEHLGEHDIGFRFCRRYWNNGYATESAKVCLAAAFNKFGMQTVVGRAMKENIASIRVLENIGLEFWKEDKCADQPGVIYRKHQPQM